MTTNTYPKVTPVHLDQLRVQLYKSLQSATLVTDAGAVLAQVDLNPTESAEHLQFRLLRSALGQQQLTAEGTQTMALAHNGMLTTDINGDLVDFDAPNLTRSSDLRRQGGRLVCDGNTLERNTLSVGDARAGEEQ